MKKMICFDMDGTIADLYGVDGWLDMLRAENPYPYIAAEPMWDMVALRATLLKLSAAGWEIRVISWLSKDSSEGYKKVVRKAKQTWLEKYNFPMEKAHFVAYGTTKADCIRRVADAAILVDDNAKVRDGWRMGETINPLDGDLIERLEALL